MSRRVLVTGGGSGIGRSTAVALARAGWRVAITGRREEALLETAEIEPVHVASCDLARDGAPETLVAELLAGDGGLDAIVHCAGVADLVSTRGGSVEALRSLMHIHVDAALALTTAAWDALCAAAPGRVVLYSSVAAADPFPGLGLYGVAKAAAEGLVRSIHSEGEANLLAFGIAPGAFDTPMLRALFDADTVNKIGPGDPETLATLTVRMLEGEFDHEAGTTRVVLPGG